MRHKIRSNFFAPCLLSILPSVAFGGALPTSAYDSFTQFLQDTASHAPPLGMGYDSSKDSYSKQCIKGTNGLLPNSLSYLFPIYEDPSLFAHADQSNFQAQGNYAYDYFSVVASRPYAYAQGVGFTVTVANQYLKVDYPPLNDLGTASYATSLDEFHRVCGDRFVSQREIGGGLVSSVQIHFANFNEKNVFFSLVKAGAAPLNDKFVQTIADSHIDGVVVVRPLQVGGDPRQLLSLKNKLGQAIEPIAICSFRDIQPCRELVEVWNEYLRSEKFSDQLNIADLANYDGPSVRAVALADYSSEGILVERKYDPARALLDRELQELARQIARLTADIDRVEILLGYFAERLSQQQSTTLVKLRADLLSNRSVAKSLGMSCIDTPNTCIQNIQSTTLLPIERALLELPQIPAATPNSNPQNTETPALPPSAGRDSTTAGGLGTLNPFVLFILLASYLLVSSNRKLQIINQDHAPAS